MEPCTNLGLMREDEDCCESTHDTDKTDLSIGNK